MKDISQLDEVEVIQYRLYQMVGRDRGYMLVMWCVQEFSKYGASIEWILEALHARAIDKGWYNTDQRMVRGVRDYLKEFKGLDIPFRVGYYKKLEEV